MWNFRLKRSSNISRHFIIILCICCVSAVLVQLMSPHTSRFSAFLAAVKESSSGHPLTRNEHLGSGRYVSLCTDLPMMDIRRTGNHLFMLAAAMYLAERTNRTVLMPRFGWPLDEWFQTDAVERYAENYPCPCLTLRPWTRYFFHGDQRLDTEHGFRQLQRSTRRTIALCGLYQTHRFADVIAPSLRRLLRFRPEVQRQADAFMAATHPAGWSQGSYTRVAVHVRRGDFLAKNWINLGATVVDRTFIAHVVDFFMARLRRVQFVVTTDDLVWTKEAFKSKFIDLDMASRDSSVNASLLNVSQIVTKSDVGQEFRQVSAVFSEGHSAGVDLAILSSCDAVVVSTGSFGWWAAWLAGKTTVYFVDWPRSGSNMDKLFNASYYWPSEWIPLR